MGKTCVICNRPSGMYPLCREHLQMKAAGDVIKCPECGTWHLTKEKCPKCNAISPNAEKCPRCGKYHLKGQQCIFCEQEPEEEAEEIESESQRRKCIICGETANEHLFCRNCYYKYKNKSLLLKVTDCKKFELLDDSYEGRYDCSDGHVVKSKSEVLIDEYLFGKKIPHAYESAIYVIDDNGKKVELHPDFCLYIGDEKVYIEHWGYDESNEEYTRMKNYKLHLYEKEGITLICTYEKSDMKNHTAALDFKLRNYQQGKINFLE